MLLISQMTFKANAMTNAQTYGIMIAWLNYENDNSSSNFQSKGVCPLNIIFKVIQPNLNFPCFTQRLQI